MKIIGAWVRVFGFWGKRELNCQKKKRQFKIFICVNWVGKCGGLRCIGIANIWKNYYGF